MTIREFFHLLRLLIKYRSLFSASHRKRNVMDEIALDILDHMRELAFEPGSLADDSTDIPF